MTNQPRRSTEPHSRLTRIADAMGDAMREHEEHTEDVRAIVMLMDEQDGGVAFYGYPTDEEQRDAVVDLLMHARAIAQALGGNIHIATGLAGGQG